MNDFITATIRTVTPMIVGAVVSWLVTLGLGVTAEFQAQLIILTTFILQVAYYLIVKAAEKKWPKIGILLGVPKEPVYGDKAE